MTRYSPSQIGLLSRRRSVVFAALVAQACASHEHPTAGTTANKQGTMVELAHQALAERSLAKTTGDERAQKPYEALLQYLRDNDVTVPDFPGSRFSTVYNQESVIPPMCYTRTETRHNPCYVCHQDRVPGRPNTMDDGALQQAYSFSEVGTQNHWQNLFEDRSARVLEISDEEILAWIEQDNYSDLSERLQAADFTGYIPDLQNLQAGAEAFDEEGIARDGSHWVAFNYKPMPSTFWPTNGSTDDVMIRLPQAFRTAAAGAYERDVYKANLALVEANIKGLSNISVRAIDERRVGEDLNGDGSLGVVDRIDSSARYVGAARDFIKLPYLYPLDTEFLHSVRYVGVNEAGDIHVPRRMKELRYMRKRFLMTQPQLYEGYLQERYDKEAGYLPGYVFRGQRGLDNEMGWFVAGFIENRRGQLRFNTFEENMFCMGCHTSLGATIDNVFSFARKVDGADGWGYIDLHDMPDVPNIGEARGEIATYLERVGGGGEFRSNPEVEERFFTDGQVDPAKLAQASDVYALITPSRDRALQLNKAYRVIVSDQDFIFGRDATVTPPPNVHPSVDNVETRALPSELARRWDIRLQWPGQAPPETTDFQKDGSVGLLLNTNP